jgi:hypothetical protein
VVKTLHNEDLGIDRGTALKWILNKYGALELDGSHFSPYEKEWRAAVNTVMNEMWPHDQFNL